MIGSFRRWSAPALGAGLLAAASPAAAQDGAGQGAAPVVVLAPITLSAGGGATGPLGGLAPDSSATGTKTGTPLRQTPQAVAVVGAEQIAAQGAQTVSAALGYSAGVVSSAMGTQTRYDAVIARGFGGFYSSSNFSDYLDGLKIMRDARISPQVDPWLLERVEVFRGPASVLYGAASPGGFVNMVSKAPVDTPLRHVRLSFGTRRMVEQAFDFGGPMAGRDDLSYRLTGLGRRASDRSGQKDQRVALSGALRWQPGAATSLTVFASLHRDPAQFNWYEAPLESTVLPGRPRVPRGFWDGDRDWSQFARTQVQAGYQLDHEFDSGLTLSQRVMFQHFKATTRELYVSGYADPADPASTLLTRGGLFMLHDWNAVSTDTRLTAEAATGPVEHRLLFGLDARKMVASRPFGRMKGLPTIDYLHPDQRQPISDPTKLTQTRTRVWQVGAYAQDQMQVGNWHLLAGLRHDWAGDRARSSGGPGPVKLARTQDQALTWRVGAVYDAAGGWAPYASYSTSFELQAGADFHARPFQPTRGKQFEVGVKYQPREDLLLTVAAFDLRRTNVLSADPDPSHMCDGRRCSMQTGEVHSRGVEFEAQGDLGGGWSLAGQASLWDVKVTRSTEGLAGKRPIAVPQRTAALWLQRTWDSGALNGLTLGGGVRHVGPTWGDRENTLRVPASTLIDASVKLDLGARDPALSGIEMQASARNLADRRYLASCNGTSCIPAPGRELRVSLDYRW